LVVKSNPVPEGIDGHRYLKKPLQLFKWLNFCLSA
jgi:hypothetical protein